MTHRRHVTTATGPQATALARLRALGAAPPPGDGVAVFARVYLPFAEAAGRNPGAGRVPRPRPAGVLGGRCAERCLAAVDPEDDPGRPPACWRPLLQFRRHPQVRPAQFALAGLHAHVGHDLPLAVVDACRTLGCAPGDLEDEFDRVAELLLPVEERVRDELTPDPDALLITDPLTHLLGCWSLERARDAAWVTARALWSLRGLPELAGEFTERLDAAVGCAGRMLLTPLPVRPTPRTRNPRVSPTR
ncbi:DUF5995 family protein [Streptomyces griseoviridis]|uniref:Uncharacterized protein n=1 Tax=Streptomyces griseoviridis TaxID=45398 RepID=A0A918LEM2_STRGD|nr:DUF5995 family protein [Streptomyces niveoruber]GGS35909.1 hypothetical protein GCM10010238_26780 [Streptomyces niveoruber]